jgi:hypothetical protein
MMSVVSRLHNFFKFGILQRWLKREASEVMLTDKKFIYFPTDVMLWLATDVDGMTNTLKWVNIMFYALCTWPLTDQHMFPFIVSYELFITGIIG